MIFRCSVCGTKYTLQDLSITEEEFENLWVFEPYCPNCAKAHRLIRVTKIKNS